ncbi:MAG: hypothetical protein H8E26_00680 [FCB group bacterium]|nr:hypothetical protein [FCB group bacterium]MBL7028741.1 hypothetical protein [Candidatus Neomarinimicrobiota bacterium]MBL7120655.1 hypothetical protein [Candidatus Neomarinimicrobiota bacterium]
MKIRRSARTILAILLLLSVFTLLTAWHNKAPGTLSNHDRQVLIKALTLKNHGLSLFLENMKLGRDNHGFYAVSNSDKHPWPANLWRASYHDPIVRSTLTPDAELCIRYRSVEDFLLILDKVESQTPGILNDFNFQNYQIIPEAPITFSLRLLLSIFTGVVGLVIVRSINRK